MRLPYAPTTPDPAAGPDTAAIYARVAARRTPRPLIPLDLALLHSPPVADGWNSFLGAIRSATTLDAGLLELAVCRVAVLNGAVYEWNAHAPLALRGGIEGRGLQACREVPVFDGERGREEGWFGEGLGKAGWAVLAYTDQMTREIKVSDRVFEALKTDAGLSDREIVELTTAVGAYNCVSRFLVALDVGENNDKEMKSVDELVANQQKRKE